MKYIHKTLLISALFLLHFDAFAQNKTLFIAHYNVENLFDTINAPDKNDEDFLPEAQSAWNNARYVTKLQRLSRVVMEMNDGLGPDLLGLCEVENRAVVEELKQQIGLKKRKYAIAHFESPDNRGIDVALLYDQKKFKLLRAQSLRVILPGDEPYPTRDVLLATGLTRNKARLHVFVNHWPSRRGGAEASAPNRIAAAARVKQAVDSLRQHDPNAYIVIMGDFNDSPLDEAPRMVLGADSSRDIQSSLYNPFIAASSDSTSGSYRYRGDWSYIDHIILSTNMFTSKSKLRYIEQSAGAVFFSYLLEQEGRFAGNPWRTYAGTNYIGGYSDHLPVMLKLELRK